MLRDWPDVLVVRVIELGGSTGEALALSQRLTCQPGIGRPMMSADASGARATTPVATRIEPDVRKPVAIDMSGASEQVGDSAGPPPTDAQLCHGSVARPDVILDVIEGDNLPSVEAIALIDRLQTPS